MMNISHLSEDWQKNPLIQSSLYQTNKSLALIEIRLIPCCIVPGWRGQGIIRQCKGQRKLRNHQLASKRDREAQQRTNTLLIICSCCSGLHFRLSGRRDGPKKSIDKPTTRKKKKQPDAGIWLPAPRE